MCHRIWNANLPKCMTFVYSDTLDSTFTPSRSSETHRVAIFTRLLRCTRELMETHMTWPLSRSAFSALKRKEYLRLLYKPFHAIQSARGLQAPRSMRNSPTIQIRVAKFSSEHDFLRNLQSRSRSRSHYLLSLQSISICLTRFLPSQLTPEQSRR